MPRYIDESTLKGIHIALIRPLSFGAGYWPQKRLAIYRFWNIGLLQVRRYGSF